MLATVLLSQGVPMLLAGDERGRTQGGNNNGYCHDTPRTWLHWDDDWLSGLVTRLIALRASQPVLRRSRFLAGDPGDGSPADVRWLAPDGSTMDDEWQAHERAHARHAPRRPLRRRARRHAAAGVPRRRRADEVRAAGRRRSPCCSTPPTSERAGYVARDALDVGAWSVVVLRDESERPGIVEVGVAREHADPEAGASLRGAE